MVSGGEPESGADAQRKAATRWSRQRQLTFADLFPLAPSHPSPHRGRSLLVFASAETTNAGLRSLPHLSAFTHA
jgi:hypothetical protein